MLDIANLIFSNTSTSAINSFTVINQTVRYAFRHILSVITPKRHQLARLLSFDERVNTLLDTGVLSCFWRGVVLSRFHSFIWCHLIYFRTYDICSLATVADCANRTNSGIGQPKSSAKLDLERRYPDWKDDWCFLLLISKNILNSHFT